MAERKKSTKKAAPKKKAKKPRKVYKAEPGVVWVDYAGTECDAEVYTIEPHIEKKTCYECGNPNVRQTRERRAGRDSWHGSFCAEFMEQALKLKGAEPGIYKVTLNPTLELKFDGKR